ncbi:hypothetical protein DMENIID0001_132060 [Sergentomyia squamirostris]
MSVEVILGENCENSENGGLKRVATASEDDCKHQVHLTLDDYRRILRELDQNRDLQNRRREKLRYSSQFPSFL